MPAMTMVQAIQDALRIALREDPRVVLLGEDIGKAGGVFRVTEGLQAEFGEQRVVDTPLAENGIVGGAIGMAMYGLKPIAEIQFVDFIYPAFDQIVSEMAKLRWRSAGQYACPVVVRAPYGGGIKGGLYHSQSPEAYFCHTAGLTVVIPATPSDAKGLLLAALAGDDPVIFLEPKRLYRSTREDVAEGAFTVPLGRARVARSGEHCTVLAYGAMVPVAVEAAEAAGARGWSVEVVDLRTLAPLDTDAVLASVRRTGRVVILHEAPRTCGYGAELAALIAEQALTSLQAPVLRVTGYDTPFPYTLEHSYLPDAPRTLRAIEHAMTFA
ncbi:MAG: alpha-ketoacid dehydrogenase subunit beta [Candidatus Eisenbacteria bacterium]|uniref:3-methyl-2-oxobutanoate dehydrogenase (2-methylpropanoyl-transferring) n=1 Tax=Eiseniibacteriota bacterium TaxID=2212470 RepID=A0A9D6L6P1_UNCEI|nr:alpha-ketoacid dehydrogenase subunit beta [Candidatus Eisenbacteria bacterium]MBI3539908.1 alpha-ketoacid dehydrogenase subunit beta [Candidatus Eisenbacteria bacterium]